MLSRSTDWRRIAEINPPELPDMGHLALEGVFDSILVTDNVFGRIRVSPYAYAARITHDVPGVHPTIVVSTRDRNILAIESEVRGALGNGVDSFLVVVGDTMPAIEHQSHHYEIVEHLRELQVPELPAFEVGMPTRFRRWQYRRRMEIGAQFLVAGPVVSPGTLKPQIEALQMDEGDPPLFLMVIPPFGIGWVDRMEEIGAVPASESTRRRLSELDANGRRDFAWDAVATIEQEAEDAGCAGVVLAGLKKETLLSEAATRWRVHTT